MRVGAGGCWWVLVGALCVFVTLHSLSAAVQNGHWGDTMHARGLRRELAQEESHVHGHASFGRSPRDLSSQDRSRGLRHAYAGANGVKLDHVCSCGLKRAAAAPSLLKGSCAKGPCCLRRVHARSGGPWRADAGSDKVTHARSGELKPGWAGSAGRGGRTSSRATVRRKKPVGHA